MEKTIICDGGPLISLTITYLELILPKLKEPFGGNFLIVPEVCSEIITKPLRTKKFELEALQINQSFKNDTLAVIKEKELFRTKNLKRIMRELTKRIDEFDRIKDKFKRK